MDLSRRATLETGLGALTAITLAGCLDDSSTGDPDPEPEDDDPAGDSDSEPDDDHQDDYPEGTADANGTETGATDEHGYETYAIGGQEIPMAPTADVYDWYTNDEELVIVDARTPRSYERRHIEGAVSSPAPNGLETDDPLADVATDTRIVAYCTCPRQVSGLRAATLIENGYTDVYLLKEGLYDWIDHGHPVVGTTVE